MLKGKTKEFILNKAKGSLSGLAIGDSLGDAARKNENVFNYGITTDFNEEASWSTDDTEFGLLTAEALIESQGNLTSEVVTDLWIRHVVVEDDLKRGGFSETEAAWNLRRGLRAPHSGLFNAYGHSDGAAMRVGPIGIVAAGNPDLAAKLAEIDASISHNRDGIWGAQAVAVAVSMAMVDAQVDDIFREIYKVIPKDSWFYESMQRATQVMEIHNYNPFSVWMPLHDTLRSTYKSTVPEAVTAALAIFKMENQDFVKSMILACNFGRDADTIGAIVGAILGARLGAEEIPTKWLEKTRYPTGTCLEFTKGMDLFEKAEQLAGLIKL